MSSPLNLCLVCDRVKWDDTERMDEMKAHCKAFPKGIPQAILMNQKDHRNPIDGDHGIQFERREGVSDKDYKAITSVFNQ